MPRRHPFVLRWIQSSDLKAMEAQRNLLQGLDYVEEKVEIPFQDRVEYINTIRLNQTNGNTAENDSGSIIDSLKSSLNFFGQTGSDNKRHVVFLHGYAAGLGFFFQNFARLQRQPFQVHALDWLGMGNSSRPSIPAIDSNCNLCKKESHSSEDTLNDSTSVLDRRPVPIDQHVYHTESYFVESLEHWRRQSGIPKMTLVAHSMGGYLSTCYAERYPDRVEKLILVSPAGVPEPQEHHLRKPTTFAGRLAHRLWSWSITPQRVIRTLGPYGRRIVSRYTKARFSYLSNETSQLLGQYAYHITVGKGSGEFALHKLLRPTLHARIPIGERLKQLNINVGFLYGSHDWMDYRHAVEVVRDIKSTTKDRELGVTLVEGGHHLYLDNPDGFHEALMKELGFPAQEREDVVSVH